MIQLVLAVLLVAALVLGAARTAAARSAGGRVDPLAVWAAVLAPAAAVFGWVSGGFAVPAALACIGLWFAYRTAGPRGQSVRPPGAGRAASFYHLALTGAAAWCFAALSGPGGAHPANGQLGSLIMHVVAAIVLLIACAGWLLGSFAQPEGPPERPSRVLGVQEALLAAALSVCFYALA